MALSVLIVTVIILTAVPKWWSKWGFRFLVVFSCGANAILGLLSRTRRRAASGWWAKGGQMALVLILWVLYPVAEKATTTAISDLTLCGSDVSEDEKQLVALWAPFLLLHLGGPDNLTAYALEDNKISARKWFEIVWNIWGVFYAIYRYIYRGAGGRRSGVLLAASVIMFIAGATRYLERVYALWKANLERMQEDAAASNKKKTPRDTAESSSGPGCYSSSSTEDKMMVKLKCRIERKLRRRGDLCDGEALLLAQDLFPIWRHAMIDSSVMPKSPRQLASEKILWLQWRSMCKVAEMELSLMYEVLYTKAIVAYNWLGWYYLIRFLSPLCTATAALLFWLHRQQQQQQQQQQGHGGGGHRPIVIRGSFVSITYALLIVDFLLDLAWLLRALGSTWMYAYLQAQAPAWLQHQVLCPAGRWRCLHRFVVCVDPMRWLLGCDPVSYRTWSGTIGRYNLLRECTATATCRSQCLEWLVSLFPGDRHKELPYLSHLTDDVKELLFKRVQTILREAVENDRDKKKKKDPMEYYMVHIRTKWGEKAFHQSQRDQRLIFQNLRIDDKEAPQFGQEFEEDVLTWHIATCIFLQYIRQTPGRRRVLAARSEAQLHEKAIKVMSEYMMFLVAVRREMLPGLVLHSLIDATRKELEKAWCLRTNVLSTKQRASPAKNEEKLAMLLRQIRRKKDHGTKWKELKGTEGTKLLTDAVVLFGSLTLAGDTSEDRRERQDFLTKPKASSRGVRRVRDVPVPDLLEFIFNVWVDKLVYAAVRCSRESHAKQLSAGGGLTTVLWMVIQHAGPFRTGEHKPIFFKPHDGDDEKRGYKKKEDEEKPVYPHPYGPPVCGCRPCYPPCCPPMCSWCRQPQWSCPLHDKPEHEPDMTTITPTATRPDQDREVGDEESLDSDEEEDIEEYNAPIEYVTLR